MHVGRSFEKNDGGIIDIAERFLNFKLIKLITSKWFFWHQHLPMYPVGSHITEIFECGCKRVNKHNLNHTSELLKIEEDSISD
jgi:hypothetical protein